jgi:ABC-2 type transport system permease protein
MVGKLLPYVAIGLIQTTLILIVGKLLFDVPTVGRFADLYAAALLFIGASLGLGLFVSTLAQTQFQAFQLAFVTMLPSILLSGFMFPFEGMPVVAQWIAQVLPLTHFNVIVRGVMLRGADLPEVWPQLGKLALFLVVMLAIAVARFKKRLD